jgi:hypothetical protein
MNSIVGSTVCPSHYFHVLNVGPLSIRERLRVYHLECRECDQEPSLCFGCQHIRPGHLLRCEGWTIGTIQLGSIMGISKRRDHCSFCRIVARTIFHTWEAAGLKRISLPDSQQCWLERYQSTGQTAPCFRILFDYPHGTIPLHRSQNGELSAELQICFQSPHCLIPSRSPDLAFLKEKVSWREPHILDKEVRKETKSLQSDSVEAECTTPVVSSTPVNWDLVKGWIRTCETQHSSCEQVLHGTLPPSFRVIDVEQRCIVLAPPRCRYAALSYVWGPLTEERLTATMANCALLSIPGAFSKFTVPHTIADAMEACGKLGERYLWVDSLCITQDDQDMKIQQINAMSAIYSLAVVTIVAASSDSAASGIPGVKNKMRRGQCRAVLQGIEVVQILPDIEETVFSSRWNTRGWTYQEYFLSRRCIFFTQFQVYFSCKVDGYLREDVCGWREDSVNRHTTKGIWNDESPRYLKSPFIEYIESVEIYTGRELSMPSDILNGFAGIAGFLSARADTSFVFGLPESSFEEALLWNPRLTVINRRKASEMTFPSWSWISQIGPVEHRDIDQLKYKFGWDGLRSQCDRRSMVFEWFISTHHGLSRLKSLVPRLKNAEVLDHDGDYPSNSQLGQLATNSLRCCEASSFDWIHSAIISMSQSQRELAIARPGRLLFQAHSVLGSLVHSSGTRLYLHPPGRPPFQVTRHFVHIDESLGSFVPIKKDTESKFELVAITVWLYRNLSTPFLHRACITSMIISLSEGIARRLGLCMVPLEEWKEGLPQAKIITLE